MKKFFIYFSVFTVAFLAFFDAKGRFEELDDVAANTPSQVEMKQMINRPDGQMKNQLPDYKNTTQQSSQMFQDRMKNNYQQNQLNNVNKRRGTIDNKAVR